MKVHAGALAEAIVICAVFAFLVVGGAIIALGFGGRNALEMAPPVCHLTLFLASWITFIVVVTDWGYVVRK